MKHQSNVIQPIKIFVLQAPMQAVVKPCITRRMRAQHGQNHKQTHQVVVTQQLIGHQMVVLSIRQI